jgi:hypothetical protein
VAGIHIYRKTRLEIQLSLVARRVIAIRIVALYKRFFAISLNISKYSNFILYLIPLCEREGVL